MVPRVFFGPETVLAVVRSRFAGRAGGATTELRTWNVITVRSGKLVRSEAFTEARNALGACLRA